MFYLMYGKYDISIIVFITKLFMERILDLELEDLVLNSGFATY